MELYQTRLCKSCGDRIRGRSDKLYCDDRCRNRFHNREKKRPVLTVLARSIQHQLLKNRMVLHRHLGGANCRVVHRDQLLREGFSFNLFTNRCRNKRGVMVVFCYEFGYRVVSQNRLMIVRQSHSVRIFR